MSKSAKRASQKRHRGGSRRKCRRGGAPDSYADPAKDGEEPTPNVPPDTIPAQSTEASAPQEEYPPEEEEYPHNADTADTSSATNADSTESAEPKSIWSRFVNAFKFWKGGSHKRQKHGRQTHRRQKTSRRK
jgi:hypothetical protein